MMKHIALAAVLAMSAVPAWAAGQEPGAMAGGSYLPSTHSKGCSGLMCDGNDPERAPNAPPPVACQGLICGMTPYSMSRPLTAAEAQRIQQEQARTPVAAPVAAAEPAKKPKRSARRKKAVKTAVARTPDTTSTAPVASKE